MFNYYLELSHLSFNKLEDNEIRLSVMKEDVIIEGTLLYTVIINVFFMRSKKMNGSEN
jgi:hypothetical protein